jgi:hypothetical protein
MAELISKSKTAKREKAKEKEADEEQLGELDTAFKTLADVRLSAPLPLSPSPNLAGRPAPRQPAHGNGPHEARAAGAAQGRRGG